jgi:vacuolar-type H+-ATPase subunit E/Vma4
MSGKPLDVETRLIDRIVERRRLSVSKAEERANKILESAKEEVKRIEEESDRQILSLVGSELKAVRDRVVGGTELEGRKMLMTSRQEVLSNVYSEVERKLSEIIAEKSGEPDYMEILEKLIVEGAIGIGGKDFIVSANERDIPRLKKNLRKLTKQLRNLIPEGSLTLDEKPVNIMGGVIIKNKEDSKVYVNSLEGRLTNVRTREEARVAEILGVI